MGCCESRLKYKHVPTKLKPESPYYKNNINETPQDYNENVVDDHPKLVIEEISKNKVHIPHTIPPTLQYIRKLNNCFDSEVYLLDNNTVLKKYPNTRSGRGQYANEIEAYRILRGCYFVLNILTKNTRELSFTIPFINGHHIKNNKTISKVDLSLDIMRRKYGLDRLKPISWTNILVQRDSIYLIDFGGIPLKYMPGGKVKWRVNKSIFH